jgi:hypothetical protein
MKLLLLILSTMFLSGCAGEYYGSYSPDPYDRYPYYYNHPYPIYSRVEIINRSHSHFCWPGSVSVRNRR